MKIGIAIDRYKLPVFNKHLTDDGYTYTTGDGVTADTMMLYVEADSVAGLEGTIRAANKEASRGGWCSSRSA